jgi:methylated-DNA-[protein]-cysteine S-methyltransferase
MQFVLDRIPSPVGEIFAVTSAEALHALDFHDYTERMHRLLEVHYGSVELLERRETLGVRERLDRYFDGDFDAFAGLALRTNGTPFQSAVWTALCTIPPGSTTSYGAIARALGTPAGARAVGIANGANPIGIIVPCHRVIGADGSLTGYGGGLERKSWLLRHEGARLL